MNLPTELTESFVFDHVAGRGAPSPNLSSPQSSSLPPLLTSLTSLSPLSLSKAPLVMAVTDTEGVVDKMCTDSGSVSVPGVCERVPEGVVGTL